MASLLGKAGKRGLRVGAMTVALVVGLGASQAQTAGDPSSQDKQFLKDTAQDSNYEIKTGQLALQKSSSADVKQYANMLVRDHTRLNQETAAAESAVKMEATSAGSMSLGDTASYAKLKLLSGDSFDQAYIKGLVKGNADSEREGKAEASGSAVPAIKKLAEHRVALDTKHTQKAEQLAQAHHVQVDK